MTNDPLLQQLQDQAQAFNPDPPPGARRHVLSALESLSASRTRPRRGPLYWVARGAAVAAIIALAAILIVHQYSTPRAPIVKHSPSPRPAGQITVAVVKATDPSALAERFVDQPLEGELQNLMIDLGRAKDSITRALPIGMKRHRPATQPPSRVL
jgi:hypothetical protein